MSLADLEPSQDAPPVGRSAILADAESLELVMSMPLHGLRRLARQNVGEMAEEELARGAQDSRQRLLRLDAPVDEPDRALADVAMAAGAGRFAEHAQQRLTSAARCLAQRHQVVELGHFDLAYADRERRSPEFGGGATRRRQRCTE